MVCAFAVLQSNDAIPNKNDKNTGNIADHGKRMDQGLCDMFHTLSLRGKDLFEPERERETGRDITFQRMTLLLQRMAKKWP